MSETIELFGEYDGRLIGGAWEGKAKPWLGDKDEGPGRFGERPDEEFRIGFGRR